MSLFSAFNVIEYKYIQLIVFRFEYKKIRVDTKHKINKRRILSTI